MSKIATYFAVYALAMAVSMHAKAGDKTGNSSNPLEFLFGKMRARVSDVVLQSKFISLEPQNPLDRWILENYQVLAQDIQSSPHVWIREVDKESEHCAFTQPLRNAPIEFSPTRCKEEGFVFLGNILQESQEKILSFLVQYLAKEENSVNRLLDRESELVSLTLIHESVHHLRGSEHRNTIEEETFANAVAERIWMTWFTLKTTISTGPAVGFYRSEGNKKFVEPLLLSKWPDGSFYLSGAKMPSHAQFPPLKLQPHPSLPSNVLLHKANLTIDGCSMDYILKLYATSPDEFYIEEYYPSWSSSIKSDGYRYCRDVSFYSWKPHLQPYRRINYLQSRVTQTPDPEKKTTLVIDLKEVLLFKDFDFSSERLEVGGREIYLKGNNALLLKKNDWKLTYTLNSTFFEKNYSVKFTGTFHEQKITTEVHFTVRPGETHLVTFW